MSDLQVWSIFALSIGVLINVVTIPPYPGVAIVGDNKKQWLYSLRKYIGNFANLLIFIGALGQLLAIILGFLG